MRLHCKYNINERKRNSVPSKPPGIGFARGYLQLLPRTNGARVTAVVVLSYDVSVKFPFLKVSLWYKSELSHAFKTSQNLKGSIFYSI